jgi:hypothetical protein
MHVGDDIVIYTHNLSEAAAIVSEVGASPLRMNPAKQSVGAVTSEFLRVAVGAQASRGYANRCISSVVSGNWTHLVKVEPGEALQMFVSNAWTLRNRTGNTAITDLMVTSMERLTGIPVTEGREVLRGNVQVNDLPYRSNKRRVCTYTYDHAKTQVRSHSMFGTLTKSYATHDYLSGHCDPFEREVLEKYRLGVKQAMFEASYAKTFVERMPHNHRISRDTSFKRGPNKYGGEVDTAGAVFDRKAEPGVLSGYPILQLVRNALTDSMLKDILSMLGRVDAVDPYFTAWGTQSRGVNVDGWLPFSDASRAGGRTQCDTLYVGYPIYV